MSKYISFLLAFFLYFSSCTTPNKPLDRIVKTEEGKMLVGLITSDALKKAPFSEWFFQNYDAYEPDMIALKPIAKKIRQYRIEIYMGTWCDDSKKQVPAFLKILKAIKYPETRLAIYALNKKKESFYGEQIKRNITHVPTIIFIKEGKEIGRIVETPKESLEQDMANIILGTPYQANYSED